MNKIDGEILRILQTDGRRSHTDIGASVHLSVNAVADRVRKMTKSGVIRSVQALIDPAALGMTIEAQIDVKLRPATSADAFEKPIRLLPQVMAATLLTESFDYALRVACVDRCDLAAVTEFIRNKAGAQETYSRIILREVRLGDAAPKLTSRAAAAPPRRS